MTDFSTILDDFTFLDDWDDRYKYLIDIGRNLEAYPEDRRDENHKVKGCASQVWLAHEVQQTASGDKIIKLYADSDAHIVRGLVALILALYSGKTPAQIKVLDAAEELKPMDLQDHLTPQRSNGLASMIGTVQSLADHYNDKAS